MKLLMSGPQPVGESDMPTEGTLIAAVSDLEQGDLVLSVLLDSRRSKTQITEKILIGPVGKQQART